MLKDRSLVPRLPAQLLLFAIVPIRGREEPREEGVSVIAYVNSGISLLPGL